MDKVIQLPFYIPPHDERMHEFSGSLLNQLPDDMRSTFEGILPIIGLVASNNPRATVRFVNNLLIDQEINNSLAATGAMEKVPIGYFAISRSLQQRWREVFNILFNSPDICTKLSEWDPSNLSEHTEDPDQKEDAILAKVLQTDEELKRLLYSPHGLKWLQNTALRKAAIQFLRTQRVSDEEHPSPTRIQRQVFLSYSPLDEELAHAISSKFKAEGISHLWVSHKLSTGEDWFQFVHRAIAESAEICLLVTPNSMNSKWAMVEIGAALGLGKRGVALLSDLDMFQMPEQLHRFQCYDIDDIDQYIAKLKRRLAS